MLTDHDVYLFKEGSHGRLYEKLGCQLDATAARGFARLGAERAQRLGDRRVQRLGPERQSAGRARRTAPASGRASCPASRAGTPTSSASHRRTTATRLDKADPFALLRRGAAGDRIARVVARLRAGATTSGWRRDARANALDAPISIYEVHLGSWRRVPTATARSATASSRDQLAEYVQRHGLHARRAAAGHRASVLRLVGLPDDRLLRADGALRHAAGLHVPRRHAAPARHRRDPRLGAVALPERRARPRAISTARTCTSTPTRARASTRSGTRYIFNYGRNEVRGVPAVERAVLARQATTSTACAWTRSPRCCTSTTRASAGEWIPNRYGGSENLEAIDFLRTLNEAVYRDHPDVQTIAEESTAWPMVSRPAYVGRPGLRHEVEHGLDARHARLLRARTRSTASTTTTSSPSRIWYAFNENFVLPLSHDEVVHGKGSLIGKMPGDDWQQFANLRAAVRLHVGAPGQEAAVHGRRVRPAARVGARRRARLAAARSTPSTRACSAGSRDLNRLYRARAGAARARLRRRRASSGSTATTPSTACSRFLRKPRDRRRRVLVVCNFTPVPRANYRVGVPRGGYWREVLNSDAHALRRQRRGQPRRRRGGAGRRARPLSFAHADAAAARDR